MNTAQFAHELGIHPDTLRKAFQKIGSYYGAVPLKAPNGRLTWPADQLPRLKGGAA